MQRYDCHDYHTRLDQEETSKILLSLSIETLHHPNPDPNPNPDLAVNNIRTSNNIKNRVGLLIEALKMIDKVKQPRTYPPSKPDTLNIPTTKADIPRISKQKFGYRDDAGYHDDLGYRKQIHLYSIPPPIHNLPHNPTIAVLPPPFHHNARNEDIFDARNEHLDHHGISYIHHEKSYYTHHRNDGYGYAEDYYYYYGYPPAREYYDKRR
jgi:hypothetical protein